MKIIFSSKTNELFSVFSKIFSSTESSKKMDMEVNQRLDSIRTLLHSFKVEQEQSILKFSDEYKFRLNRPKTNASNNPNSLQHTNSQYQFFHGAKQTGFIQPPTGSAGQSNATTPATPDSDSVMFSKITNVDSIIMPMGSDLFSNQRLWPQALNANYRELMTRIGNIESHGSLWKLIPRKDLPGVGHRVMLQSSVSGSLDAFFFSFSYSFFPFSSPGNWRRTEISLCQTRISRS
jgi:hypothetical protein